jgi:hypothetical protein
MSDVEETGADQGTDSAIPPEQLADLRRLQLAAREPNAEMQQLEDAEAEQAAAAENSLVSSNAASLSMVFELAVPTFDQFGFPNVSRVLAAPAMTKTAAGADEPTGMTNGQTLAAAWAPVLAKYNVNLGGLGDKYRLEIMAVMVTAPIAKALYVAVQIDTGAGKKAPKAVASTPAGEAPEAAEPVRLG